MCWLQRATLVGLAGSWAAGSSPRWRGSWRQPRPSKRASSRAFQYAGRVGLDAQQLAAVARPVQRAVVVVPAERDRLRPGRVDGPALVVEPRIGPVERRRGEQRADGRGDGDDPGGGSVAHAQLLEPQEGDHQQREQRAAQELALEVQHHGGHRVERHEREQRRGREAGAIAPRPEREQRGDHREQRPACSDRQPRPLVDAAVGHADSRQRVDAAAGAGQQRAPAVRPQVLVREAAREQRERDRRERDERRHDPAQRAPEARGAEQCDDHEHGESDRLPRPPGLGRLEQARPVHAGERDEARSARRRARTRAAAAHRPRQPRAPPEPAGVR